MQGIKFLNSGLLALVFFVPAVHAADYKLSDLEFMVGHWQAEDSSYEEIWLPSAEGVMTGFFRWPSVRGRYVIELLTITTIDDKVVFRFKHFDPDITAWEKDEALTYLLTNLQQDCATFTGQDLPDNVPAVFEYCRLDMNTFRFRGASRDQSLDDSNFVLVFIKK